MRTIARADVLFHSILVAVLVFSIIALAVESLHPAWALLSVPVLLIYASMALRRPLRRLRLSAKPFPPEWRSILLKNVRFYADLDDEGRRGFERDLCFFLGDQKIEGVGGVEVTDEIRVLIAAGAAVLLHGQPEWELPRGHTILVYPESFDDKFRVGREGPFLGQMHGQGPIIISRRALLEGWQRSGDGSNVVLHEFAHLMDMRSARSDGVPRMLNTAATAEWLKLIHAEMLKVKQHRSILRFYAATNEAEFFAVAVENFFERPRAMRDHHPELYRAFSEFFNQDPAGAVRGKAI